MYLFCIKDLCFETFSNREAIKCSISTLLVLDGARCCSMVLDGALVVVVRVVIKLPVQFVIVFVAMRGHEVVMSAICAQTAV